MIGLVFQRETAAHLPQYADTLITSMLSCPATRQMLISSLKDERIIDMVMVLTHCTTDSLTRSKVCALRLIRGGFFQPFQDINSNQKNSCLIWFEVTLKNINLVCPRDKIATLFSFINLPQSSDGRGVHNPAR